MSCKTLKLRNCEIKGATFQGRRFDFVNKVITNDTFKAKVYNSEGVLKTEITGLKSGSVVYFPFTTLETYDKGNYTIRYWAEFHLLGKFNIADEDFKIANSCPNCTTQNQPYPFVLDLGEDIVKFNMSFVYIQIGSGGDIDLTAYLTKEEAAETYQPKGNYASANHTHSDKANTDASNIDDHIAEWREKLNIQQTEDRVEHGLITTTSNSVTISLSPLGENFAIIDGVKYIEPTTNPETPKLFTPVTTGQKILIIHALPDAQVFHLAQGAESTEAVEPSYSGLFVARLLVTTEGIDIVEATSGFREKAVDNFAIYSLLAGDRVIGIDANMRLKVQSSGAVRIGGFLNEEDKLYSGCPISVRNDTPFDMEFYNAVDASPEFIAINSADLPFSIKPGETANFAYRGAGIAEIIKTGGGGAELPPGTNGQIYEIDNSVAEKIKPSDRLTNVETGKLDKPTTDGSWVVTKSGTTITYTDASTFGQNIANTNLTWSADRTQNLNAKKLSFTGGRVSVPALELEITAENSVPNKIWTAGTYLWHTNNLGISYRVAYDNQVIKRISGNVTLDDTYHNSICMVTGNCIIIVPDTLRADFNCVFDAIGGSKGTFVASESAIISAPLGLILRDNAMCTLYKYTSNTYRLNGGNTTL